MPLSWLPPLINDLYTAVAHIYVISKWPCKHPSAGLRCRSILALSNYPRAPFYSILYYSILFYHILFYILTALCSPSHKYTFDSQHILLKQYAYMNRPFQRRVFLSCWALLLQYFLNIIVILFVLLCTMAGAEVSRQSVMGQARVNITYFFCRWLNACFDL